MKRGLTFDAIFLDPPYREQKLEALLSIVDKANMLTDKGFILTEHAKEVVFAGTSGRTPENTSGIVRCNRSDDLQKEREWGWLALPFVPEVLIR